MDSTGVFSTIFSLHSPPFNSKPELQKHFSTALAELVGHVPHETLSKSTANAVFTHSVHSESPSAEAEHVLQLSGQKIILYFEVFMFSVAPVTGRRILDVPG